MYKNYFIFIFSILASTTIYAQTSDDLWTKTSVLEKKSLQKNEVAPSPKEFQVYDLNLQLLRNKLSKTSQIKGQKSPSGSLLTFPNANGILEKFNVFEASIMEEGLQQKYPDLRSYIGTSIDNPSTIIRFSFTPQGLHAIILNSGSTVYIDPYTADKKTYMVYLKKNLPEETPIDCDVKELNSRSKNTPDKSQNTNDGYLRTFRLAVTATGEYSQYHLTNQGVSVSTSNEKKKEIVLSAIVATMTRVNAVFERDLTITMVLIENNDKIIFLDPDTDNLTNADKYALLNETQPIVDKAIGPDNYDIGHVFAAASFGGVAYVNSFCKSIKSRAVSGNYRPKGAYFEGVITHEMGHQYGANHTFNNCEDYYIVTSTSVEPSCGGGSGSIMSYSVNYNDSYFHLVSSREIWNNIKNSCGTIDQINNQAPTLEIMPNYTIPVSTPFILNAMASDSDGDHLTYTFQQLDTEPAPFPIDPTATGGPAFRALPPDISSMRYFPDISTVIDGKLSNTWEVLPEVERTMKFGITVRDNNINGGQTTSVETKLFFNGDSGSFKVTSPTINTIWHPKAIQTIKWNVANTNNAPVSCSSVNILLSTDGGYTFPIILASNVTNNGSYEITVPNIATNNAKIKVESIGNIFYALNSGLFTLEPLFDKTYIPDNNFEQALIDLGIDDVLDDYVLTASIKDLLKLDVNGKNKGESKKISDLTGIEDFLSLTFLKCDYNKLTSLDLSSNNALTDLVCSSNQLTRLDLSSNIALINVRCQRNNLTSLDIIENKFLSTISCSRNQLTNLNLSKNTELSTVWCSYNQIENIDVSNNSMLLKLHCFGNPISCIQVNEAQINDIPVDWKKNNSAQYDIECFIKTYVPDDNFEQALIDLGHDDILDDYVITANISEITNLNINNKNIIDLKGIEGFRNLNYLSCTNNQITNLDLSKNVDLKILKCYINQIKNLDVSDNLELEFINCRNNQIKNLNISQNLKLEFLNCFNNQIQELDLSNNKNLNFLNCKYNKLFSLNAKNGANSLITNFNSFNNPTLYCIEVDKASDANAGISVYEYWVKDPVATYSENCEYNTQAKTALNIEDSVLSEAITLYPNPVTGILNIDSGILPLRKIEVYTILGQKVKDINSDFNAIEMHDLTAGVYLIRLYSKNAVSMRKIIKK